MHKKQHTCCTYRLNIDLFKVLLAIQLFLLKLLFLLAQFGTLN